MFRSREQHRSEEAGYIKDNFQPFKMQTIHWDGKSYSCKGGVNDKRLAVVLSNSMKAKLLNVVQVTDGRAITHTNAIINTIEEWGVDQSIVSMCFDTECVNSGRFNGVCVRIENELRRSLLHLPCRHHIYEIPLSAAFEATVENSCNVIGPKIVIFEHFTKLYFGPNFDKNRYIGCRNDNFF